jgi:hypothetical protein
MVGVGGAVLVMGAVFGGLALGDHSDLANKCTNGCPASAQSEIDGYHTKGAVSTVGFIAGPVLAAAGLVMVLVAPSSSKKSTSASITPYIGFGSFGAFGRF